MSTMLITGGAGFIGSGFLRLMAAESDESLVNLDNLTYAGKVSADKLPQTTKSYRFVQDSITNPAAVESLTADSDVRTIVNFAAESHVDNSIRNPMPFFKSNIEGTGVLLEAARKRDLRYVQISTDEVYGSIPEGSFTETSPLAPSSPYSASKAAADLMVQAYVRTYGLNACITRSSNNFGPFQHPEKLIAKVILNALRDDPIPVYGNGLQVRDWIFVEDNCRGIRAVTEKGRKGEVYNIGGGNEIPNIEIIRRILRKLGRDESLIRFVEDRPGHDVRYSLDSHKIQKELSWAPKTDFEVALNATISWYQQNPQWWTE